MTKKIISWISSNQIIAMYVVLSFVLLIAALNVLGLFYAKFGIKEDNPTEEFIEYVIQENLGIQVDLTPNSEEKP